MILDFIFDTCAFVAHYSLKKTNPFVIHPQEKHKKAAVYLQVWELWEVCKDI